MFCCEIDHFLAGGRQIAAMFVDTPLEPLTHSEFMSIRVASNRQDLLRRSTPEYKCNGSPSGQNGVDPRAWLHRFMRARYRLLFLGRGVHDP